MLVVLVPVAAVAFGVFYFFWLIPFLHPRPLPAHLRPVWTLATKIHQPGCLAFSSDRNAFLIEGKQGLQFYNVTTGKLLYRIKGIENFSAATPDGQWVATSSGSAVRLWNTKTHHHTKTVKTAGTVSCMALSADGKQLATFGENHKLTLWNTAVLTPQRSMIVAKPYSQGQCVAFSPNGKAVAVETAHHGYIYNARSGALENTLETGDVTRPFDSKGCIALSPDGRFLVTVGIGFEDVETSTRVWSTSDWHLVKELDYADTVAVTFSPDSKMLATGTFDGPTYLWDTSTWQNTLDLDSTQSQSSGSGIIQVAFAADNHTLAAEDRDGIVTAWKVPVGR